MECSDIARPGAALFAASDAYGPVQQYNLLRSYGVSALIIP